MLSVSRTYLEMPVIIHEFSTAAVPSASLWELEVINQRSRLYRTRLPPDQLNPDGCVGVGYGWVVGLRDCRCRWAGRRGQRWWVGWWAGKPAVGELQPSLRARPSGAEIVTHPAGTQLPPTLPTNTHTHNLPPLRALAAAQLCGCGAACDADPPHAAQDQHRHRPARRHAAAGTA